MKVHKKGKTPEASITSLADDSESENSIDFVLESEQSHVPQCSSPTKFISASTCTSPSKRAPLRNLYRKASESYITMVKSMRRQEELSSPTQNLPKVPRKELGLDESFRAFERISTFHESRGSFTTNDEGKNTPGEVNKMMQIVEEVPTAFSLFQPQGGSPGPRPHPLSPSGRPALMRHNSAHPSLGGHSPLKRVNRGGPQRVASARKITCDASTEVLPAPNKHDIPPPEPKQSVEANAETPASSPLKSHRQRPSLDASGRLQLPMAPFSAPQPKRRPSAPRTASQSKLMEAPALASPRRRPSVPRTTSKSKLVEASGLESPRRRPSVARSSSKSKLTEGPSPRRRPGVQRSSSKSSMNGHPGYNSPLQKPRPKFQRNLSHSHLTSRVVPEPMVRSSSYRCSRTDRDNNSSVNTIANLEQLLKEYDTIMIMEGNESLSGW